MTSPEATLPDFAQPALDAQPAAGDGSPRGLRRFEQSIIIGLALIAGLVVGLAGMQPTGTAGWDSVLATVLGFMFVLAAVRSDARVLVAAGILAVAFSGASLTLLIAIAGFVAVLAGYDSGEKLERGLGGALLAVSLSQLRDYGIFGLSAIVAGLAFGAVFFSAYRQLPLRLRSQVRTAVIWVSLAIGALVVATLYQVVAIRAQANSGVDAARASVRAARAGQTEELNLQLDRAQQQLSSARDAADAFWLKPLALVPVAAQHHRSLTVVTEQGFTVADEGAAVLRDVDLDQLQLRQGQFDLDLLAALAPQLQATSAKLTEAVTEIEAQRSPWLVPPVSKQLDALIDEANQITPEATLAAEAATVLPGLLGADSERRYLMLFGSPGESREFGGFVGGYALIGVEDGGLDLVQSGSINELLEIARANPLTDADIYPALYRQVDPVTFPQNLTSTPNLVLIAHTAREIFPEIAGAPLDGVVYADPYALAAMTNFTGPVEVPGVDQALDERGMIDFMFDQQYRIYDSRQDRFAAIGALTTATAASFQNADLPGPERLGEVLGPLARGGRLQVITFDQAENDFLASVLLQRAFIPRPGTDTMAVLQANATASKLDLFLRREVSYDISVSADGSLVGTVDVLLTSDLPDDVPEPVFGTSDGTNQVLLSLYTEHELVSVTVDGDPFEVVTVPEFGFMRHALFEIPLAPNTSASVRFEVVGQVDPQEYRLLVWAQPLVRFDNASVSFRSDQQAPVSETRVLRENWLFEPGVAAENG